MSEKSKKIIAILCLLAMIMSFSGCGRQVITGSSVSELDSTGNAIQEEEKASSDGSFSLFYNSSYSLNPMLATDINNQVVCQLVYENMLEVDNDFNIIPGVITSWSSEDGKTWTFDIDPNHVFSDSTPVTARDLEYSFRMAINYERFENRFNGQISSIGTVDDDTFTVVLNKADTQFPILLSIPVIKYNTFQVKWPTGSGPYKFNEDVTELVINSEYSGDHPVNSVLLTEFASVEEFITKFEDTTVDYILNDPSSSNNLGFGNANEIRNYNTTNLHYITFNKNTMLFSLGELQYAFMYAFDREYMVDTLLNGNAMVACEPISPASPLYNTYFNQLYSYNLEECQNVLDNIGVKDYDLDGKPEYMVSNIPLELNIDFIVCIESSSKVSLADKFASDMETLGITVNVKKLSWDEYKYALNQHDYDMAYCEIKLPMNFDMTSMFEKNGSNNYSCTSESGTVSAIEDYLAASDAERQMKCDQMCQQILMKAQMIPICFEKHQVLTHKGVMSNMTINQNNPMCNFSNWKIEI